MSAVARGVVLLALLGATSLAACAPRYQHVVERPLRSRGGLECPGYLVWNREPVRDVFLVISGSGHLSNAFVHPSSEEILDTQRVAYATYDKPGIRAPFGDPAAVQRDYSIFERYTLGHGTACALETLRLACVQGAGRDVRRAENALRHLCPLLADLLSGVCASGRSATSACCRPRSGWSACVDPSRIARTSSKRLKA